MLTPDSLPFSNLFKEDSRQLHAVLLQPLREARADAGRAVAADDPAVLVHALALEVEDLLHRDRLALHAGDLGDGGDAARAVGEARGLYDEVERGGDLLAHRAVGEAHAGHLDHRLETR